MISFVLALIPTVGATIGAILATPIGIIGATLLYYDLRVRKQGYSLETLATELNAELGSGAAVASYTTLVYDSSGTSD